MSWESSLETSKWRHRARAAEAEVALACRLLREWTLAETVWDGELLRRTYAFIDDDPEAA